MRRSIFLKSAFIISLAFGFLSCTPDGGSKMTIDSPSTTPPDDEETPLSTAPLAFRLTTTYETTQTAQYQKFLETGTTTCEATKTNPVVTCTVEVPEARLYYSKLKFLASWQHSECKLLNFQPYYYLASTAAAFSPYWSEAALDCSVASPPADCYGGAAPQIVPDFPKFLSLIYFAEEGSKEEYLTADEELASGYSLDYVSNRLTASDLPLAKQGMNHVLAGDGYVANSFVGYKYFCKDDWQDPITYEINLVITDADSDSANPTDNHRDTWKEVP